MDHYAILGRALSKLEGSGAKQTVTDEEARFLFRGRHLCALTLLSAPPRETILVATAHCNYLCKDGSYPVELCCCRPPEQGNSCKKVDFLTPLAQDSLWNDFQTSSYCGRNPKVVLADPGDLQVNVLTIGFQNNQLCSGGLRIEKHCGGA